MYADPKVSFLRGVVHGLIASLSIAAGYFPIAFSFGLAALQADLSPFTTVLTSVVVYAGASQFILITLLSSGAGWFTVIPTVLLMNARHLFYGPVLLAHMADNAPSQKRRAPASALAFGLTDEVFATALGKLGSIAPPEREAWYLGLQLGAYASWVSGTLLGISLSSSFQNPPVFVQETLAFILPGLFFALLLESGIARSARTVGVTAIVTVALHMVLPSYHALALGMLAGAGFTMLLTHENAS